MVHTMYHSVLVMGTNQRIGEPSPSSFFVCYNRTYRLHALLHILPFEGGLMFNLIEANIYCSIWHLG